MQKYITSCFTRFALWLSELESLDGQFPVLILFSDVEETLTLPKYSNHLRTPSLGVGTFGYFFRCVVGTFLLSEERNTRRDLYSEV